MALVERDGTIWPDAPITVTGSDTPTWRWDGLGQPPQVNNDFRHVDSDEVTITDQTLNLDQSPYGEPSPITDR